MKKNNLLKKRFFSIILTIAVALSMMPTMAWADADGIAVQTVSDAQTESSVAEVAIQDGSTKYYDNIREAFTAADVEGQTATVKLLQDVTLDDTTALGIQLSNGGIITLDLNGFELSQRELKSNSTYLYSAVIVLDASGTNKAFLTIDDTSQSKDGAIVQPNGIAAVFNDFGNLTVRNGTLKTTTTESNFPAYPASALWAISGVTSIEDGTIGTQGYNGLWTNGVGAQLSGGTYSTIETWGESSIDSLLAEGHTFKYADNSGYPDLTQSSISQPVTVVLGSPGVSYKDANGNSQIKESTEFTYLTSSSAENPITLKAGW